MTYFTREQTARKEHHCTDCGRTIRPGEKYRAGVMFEGMGAHTWKDCAHCAFVLREYDIAWDGEYSADSFAEWAGDGFQDLTEARLQAGYRHRWTTAQGNLWPLPTSAPPATPS